MRPMIGFLALVLIASSADAQILRSRWGSSSCGQGGCDIAPAAPAWEWKPAKELWPEATDRFTLWKNGKFVGFWDVQTGYYRPWNGGEKWGEKMDKAPIDPPAVAKKTADVIPGGVDLDKLKGHDECEITLRGHKITMLEAAGALDDDSQKLWLVVTGDGRDEFLARAKADPRLADLLSRCRIWSVPDGHQSLIDRETKKSMFPVGSPGVFLGLPDGTEIFKASGPAIDLDALRKSDPLFRPKPDPTPAPKQPDPKQPDVKKPDSPDQGGSSIPMCCVAALVGAVASYVAIKTKG